MSFDASVPSAAIATEFAKDTAIPPHDKELIQRVHLWIRAFLKVRYGERAELPEPRYTFLEAYLLICQLQTIREVYYVDVDQGTPRARLIERANRLFEEWKPMPRSIVVVPPDSPEEEDDNDTSGDAVMTSSSSTGRGENTLEAGIQAMHESTSIHALPWNPLDVRGSYWAFLKNALVAAQNKESI